MKSILALTKQIWLSAPTLTFSQGLSSSSLMVANPAGSVLATRTVSWENLRTTLHSWIFIRGRRALGSNQFAGIDLDQRQFKPLVSVSLTTHN
jgi:hypothetical protein